MRQFALTISILILALIPSGQSQAQSNYNLLDVLPPHTCNEIGGCESWCKHFDFTIDQQGWVHLWEARGSYVAGSGWSSSPNSGVDRLMYYFDTPVPEITYFGMHYYTNNASTSSLAMRLVTYSADGDRNYTGIGPFAHVTGESYHHHAQVSTTNPATNVTGLRFTFSGVMDMTYLHSAWICGTGEPAPQEYVRPIKTVDYGPYGIIPSPYAVGGSNNVVYAFTDDNNDYVHAAVPGLITDVRQALATECRDIGIPYDGDTGLIDFFENGGPPGDCGIAGNDITLDFMETISFQVFRLRLAGLRLNPGDFLEYGGLTIDAHIVTVTDDDGLTWEYWVKDNSNLYIDVGMRVEAGCVVGETMRMEVGSVDPDPLKALLDYISGAETPFVEYEKAVQGIAIVHMPDALVGDEIIPSNGLEPELGLCNKPLDLAGCVTDLTRGSRSDWKVQYAQWDQDGEGITIGPGGKMAAWLNLDETRNPQVRVYWRPYPQKAFFGEPDSAFNVDILRVRLNDVIDSYSFVYDQTSQVVLFQTSILDGSTATPDPNGFFELEIRNTSPSLGAFSFLGAIKIEQICVTHQLDENGDALIDPPGECYYLNSSFDMGGLDWITSAGVTFPEPGYALLPSGDTIGQNVLLYPEDDGTTPHDYTLTVTARVRDTSEDWLFGNPTGEAEMSYTLAGGAAVSMGSYTFQEFIDGNNYLDYVGTVSIAAETTGELAVSPTLTNPGDASGVEIHRVCLSSDTWPGPYREDVPPKEPIFKANCNGVTKPSGNNVPQWINYHWESMNQFFQCDLMVLLNDLYIEFQEAMLTMKWFFKWMIVLANMTLDWMSQDVLFWLNGHLANIAGGQATFIEVNGGTETCNNIFCAFESLVGGVSGIFDGITGAIVVGIEEVLSPLVDLLSQLLGGAAGVVFDFLESLSNVFFDFIGRILDLIFSLDDLFSGVLSGISESEPEEIPGLPYCDTNPDGNILCRGIWMMDNTVLSGPGAVIPAIITGFLAVQLVLWAIKQFKQTVQDNARSV